MAAKDLLHQVEVPTSQCHQDVSVVLDASIAAATSVWRTSAPVPVLCGYRSGGLAGAQRYRCHRLAVSENRCPIPIFI